MEDLKTLSGPISYLLSFSGIIGILEHEISLATTRYAITGERILKKTGHLRRDVKSINFNRITDTEVNQGLVNRLNDTGNIWISTAGSIGYEMSLDGISDPLGINRRIISECSRGQDRLSNPDD